MKNAIKEYIEPSKQEKQSLWENAVFVFDTNVLLNLYRYSAKTRNSLLDAFESFKDRVWIPYQVAYEYMQKRCEVIYETVQRYDQFTKEVNIFTSKATDTLRLTSGDEEVSELKRYLFKWIDSNKERNLLVINVEDDEILNKILEIFDGKVGSIVDDTELEKIKKNGQQRYSKQIPPGYKDEKKRKEEDDNNAYGDLIIWMQIIKYAKNNKKGIVYVTHDQKEDWWNIVKGKTIGPRVELRREFMRETQQEFHMYSMNSFISTYNSMNENTIEKSVVEEVISLEKSANKKGDRGKSYSVSEKIARTEETIDKIGKRIQRRRNVVADIDEKYSDKGIKIPERLQIQYDNTKLKIQELEGNLKKKERELEVLKQISNIPIV